MRRIRRHEESILFNEIYLVSILMLTWFLFRLSVMVFVIQFWNVCVPSALIDFRADYIGVYWFLFATDIFALAWLSAYLLRAVRRRRFFAGRMAFVAVALVFVIGSLYVLPLLMKWKSVEHDPRASYDLLWSNEQEDWPFAGKPPGGDLAKRWEMCTPVSSAMFGNDVAQYRAQRRLSFWPYYEKRTSGDMKSALQIAEQRLSENREDGEAWAMKALVYGNGVDYGVTPGPEASAVKTAALEKALALAPGAFITDAAYALIRGHEDPEGAEVRLKRCLAEAEVRPHHRRASDPVLRECHNLYGDLLRKTGRPEQARGIYLQGLERWPDDGELRVSYALSLQETGRGEDGIEYLRKLVDEQPYFVRAHWHLAVMLYEERGDLNEVRREAVKALEMDPKIWNGEKLLLELL